MSAFFVATIKLKSPEDFKQYGLLAGQSMKPFGGEVMLKGKKSADLAGHVGSELISVVSFPDQQHLNDWYHSEEYQKLITLRDQAADITLTAFEKLT